jgi:hypothetical protein
MCADDLAYFERRAEQELDLAQRSLHPEAVKRHYLLAGLYLDRIYYKPTNDSETLAAEAS